MIPQATPRIERVKKWKTKRDKMEKKTRAHMAEYGGGTHLSVPSDFMMVSLPEDAAFTICCSTDLFILALSAYITPFSRVYDTVDRTEGVEKDRERKKRNRGLTNLVHGGLFDGSNLFGGDRSTAFLRIGGCLVGTSRIVGGGL
jgi:hypothetical protein